MRHRPTYTLGRKLLSTVLIMMAGPSAESAETRPGLMDVSIAIGSRARVTGVRTMSRPLVGVVRAMDSSSLTIETSGGATLRIPRDEIRSLEVSLERRRNTIKGAAIGAAAGAVFGALVPLEGCAGVGIPCTRGESAGLVGFGGAFWGTVFGYRSRKEIWVEVPSAPPERDERPGVDGPPRPGASQGLRQLPRVPDTGTLLYEGMRIRVLHGGIKTEGLLSGLSEDSLNVVSPEGVMTIQRSAIGRVEAWGGERKQVLRGVVLGLALGAAIDFADAPYCVSQRSGLPQSCSRIASAAETAFGGALLGATFGLFVKRTSWIPVNLSASAPKDSKPTPGDLTWQVSPTFSPTGHGGGLKLRLTW